MTLPKQYADYFANGGPTEGALTVEPGWFQLWSPDAIHQMNQDYSVEEFVPGFLGFGSSGSGELLAFDADGRVVMIPFITMSAEDAWPVANSWDEFVERTER